MEEYPIPGRQPEMHNVTRAQRCAKEQGSHEKNKWDHVKKMQERT